MKTKLFAVALTVVLMSALSVDAQKIENVVKEPPDVGHYRVGCGQVGDLPWLIFMPSTTTMTYTLNLRASGVGSVHMYNSTWREGTSIPINCPQGECTYSTSLTISHRPLILNDIEVTAYAAPCRIYPGGLTITRQGLAIIP